MGTRIRPYGYADKAICPPVTYWNTTNYFFITVTTAATGCCCAWQPDGLGLGGRALSAEKRLGMKPPVVGSRRLPALNIPEATLSSSAYRSREKVAPAQNPSLILVLVND